MRGRWRGRRLIGRDMRRGLRGWGRRRRGWRCVLACLSLSPPHRSREKAKLIFDLAKRTQEIEEAAAALAKELGAYEKAKVQLTVQKKAADGKYAKLKKALEEVRFRGFPPFSFVLSRTGADGLSVYFGYAQDKHGRSAAETAIRDSGDALENLVEKKEELKAELEEEQATLNELMANLKGASLSLSIPALLCKLTFPPPDRRQSRPPQRSDRRQSTSPRSLARTNRSQVKRSQDRLSTTRRRPRSRRPCSRWDRPSWAGDGGARRVAEGEDWGDEGVEEEAEGGQGGAAGG
jgi:hypothetical protein